MPFLRRGENYPLEHAKLLLYYTESGPSFPTSVIVPPGPATASVGVNECRLGHLMVLDDRDARVGPESVEVRTAARAVHGDIRQIRVAAIMRSIWFGAFRPGDVTRPSLETSGSCYHVD